MFVCFRSCKGTATVDCSDFTTAGACSSNKSFGCSWVPSTTDNGGDDSSNVDDETPTASPIASPSSDPTSSPTVEIDSNAECVDLEGWVDAYDFGCDVYEAADEPGCPTFGEWFVPASGISPKEACCYCQL